MKKIDLSTLNFEKIISSLQCTKCHESMVLNGDTLICNNNHQFQLNKKGTVNLALGRDMTITKYYDRNLFIARKQVQEKEFFLPLAKAIADLVPQDHILLDAGTGDGYFTDYLKHQPLNIGIDLSKEAIHEAGNRPINNTCYMVADLANLPLHDHTVDTIINVLSPANYQEFKRVLKKDGQVYKVIPTKNYLKEIREHYNINSDYDNANVKELFGKHFDAVETKMIRYVIDVANELLEAILIMTPLTKFKPSDQVPNIKKITCEFEILIGSSK